MWSAVYDGGSESSNETLGIPNCTTDILILDMTLDH
jgi:hypothetical protein